jgi:hypothetical protein
MFDEKALRKPGFAPGVSVKLGDGQMYEMRSPRLRFYASRSGGKTKTVPTGVHELGPADDEILGVVFGDVESDTWDFPTARFELAIRLLEPNYNLTEEHYQALLWFERNNPESEEMWSAIMRVIAGNAGPKTTPAI